MIDNDVRKTMVVMASIEEIPKRYYYINVKATGERISDFINRSHYRIADIAEYLGVSVQAVYHWTYGMCLPEITNLVALADLFNLGIEDLLVAEKR